MFADPGLPIEIIARPEDSGQKCRLWTNVTWDACVFPCTCTWFFAMQASK